MNAGTRYTLEISFELNERVSFEAVKEFIIDALETRGGQLPPDDPLFDSLEKVRVKQPRGTA